MNSFESTILGLVQGLTEFLPVSSSGHLVIAETFLDVPTPGVFVEVSLHLATLLAVLIVYRRQIYALVTGLLRRDPAALRYAALLLVASVPAGVVGIFFRDSIERVFDLPSVTGVMLLVTGGLLWSTRRMRTGPANDAENDPPAGRITWMLALGIGFAQAVAILPGISRSGATITAGLWAGLAGPIAAEFSFLMSIIAIAGAVALQLGDAALSIREVGLAPIAVGFLVALASGIAAIRALLWLLRRQSFYAFAYYVWAAGFLFLLYLGIRG